MQFQHSHHSCLCVCQIPELKDDVVVPEYSYLTTALDTDDDEHTKDWESDDKVKINAWFGPSGTVSPLHYDSDHNLLSQVNKYWSINILQMVYSGGGGEFDIYTTLITGMVHKTNKLLLYPQTFSLCMTLDLKSIMLQQNILYEIYLRELKYMYHNSLRVAVVLLT